LNTDIFIADGDGNGYFEIYTIDVNSQRSARPLNAGVGRHRHHPASAKEGQ